jgi:hypothetical protein
MPNVAINSGAVAVAVRTAAGVYAAGFEGTLKRKIDITAIEADIKSALIPKAVLWVSATAVFLGEVRRSPSGSLIASKSARTTGASFDAIEEANWEVATTVISVWSASLPVKAGAAYLAPDGRIITSKTARTTGATFSVGEANNWDYPPVIATNWSAANTVLLNEVKLSPTGELITSKSARTTGSTYDATEKSNWNTLSVAGMVGATAGAAGIAGAVPASAAGDQLKVLRADGTWVNQDVRVWSSTVTYAAGDHVAVNGTLYSSVSSGNLNNLVSNVTFWNKTVVATMVGSTGVAAGVAGLVPASAIGDQLKVLTAGGTWNNQDVRVWSSTVTYSAGDHVVLAGSLYTSVSSGNLNNLVSNVTFWTKVVTATMTGATSGAAGTSGVVPIPVAGDNVKVLRGDGTWSNQDVRVWSGTATYSIGEHVVLNGSLYSGLTASNLGNNPASAPANWSKLSVDLTTLAVKNWVAGTTYVAGELVLNSSAIYRAVIGSTGVTPSTDVAEVSWKKHIANFADLSLKKWVASTAYVKGDVVFNSALLANFICLKPQSDLTFGLTPNAWEPLNATNYTYIVTGVNEALSTVFKTYWLAPPSGAGNSHTLPATTDLYIGDRREVVNMGAFTCTVAPAAGSTIDGSATPLTVRAGEYLILDYYATNSWRIVFRSTTGALNVLAWAVATPYKAGDLVRENNTIYMALAAHTSGAGTLKAEPTDLWQPIDGASTVTNVSTASYIARQQDEIIFITGAASSIINLDPTPSQGAELRVINKATTDSSVLAGGTDTLLGFTSRVVMRPNEELRLTYVGTNWFTEAQRIVGWTTQTTYIAGQLILVGGALLICLADHASGSGSFDAEPTGLWADVANKGHLVTIAGAATYAIKTTDHTVVFSGAVATAVTLPAIVATENRYLVLSNGKNISIVVTPNGVDTVKGAASLTLAPSQTVTLYTAGGTDWRVAYSDTMIEGWVANKRYAANQLVLVNGTFYVSQLDHLAGSGTFAAEPTGNWRGTANLSNALSVTSSAVATQLKTADRTVIVSGTPAGDVTLNIAATPQDGARITVLNVSTQKAFVVGTSGGLINGFAARQVIPIGESREYIGVGGAWSSYGPRPTIYVEESHFLPTDVLSISSTGRRVSPIAALISAAAGISSELANWRYLEGSQLTGTATATSTQSALFTDYILDGVSPFVFTLLPSTAWGVSKKFTLFNRGSFPVTITAGDLDFELLGAPTSFILYAGQYVTIAQNGTHWSVRGLPSTAYDTTGIRTAAFVATLGTNTFVNSAGGTFVVTLPATATLPVGAWVGLVGSNTSLVLTPLTVAVNTATDKINGVANDTIILGGDARIIWSGSARGWIVTSL